MSRIPKARGKRKTRGAKAPVSKKPPNLPSGAESFGLLADGLSIGLALVDSEGNVRFYNATFGDALEFDAISRPTASLLNRLRAESRSEFEHALSEATW